MRGAPPGLELRLLRWALWTILLALAAGGKPWLFPGGGKPWLERALRGGD